jgi:predicted membrane chloride channel (bestrophin family)
MIQIQNFPFRYRASIISWALPKALLITVIAVVIVILHELINIKLSIDQMFINMIGIVVSLLLVYRVTVASER